MKAMLITYSVAFAVNNSKQELNFLNYFGNELLE